MRGVVARVRLIAEQRSVLPCSPSSVGRSFGLDCGEPPDHEADDQQEHEVQPLAGVLDDERVVGLDEEQVVDHERCDGGKHGRERAAYQPDDHHREQIERRRVRHLEWGRFGEGDEGRRDGDGARGHGRDQDGSPSRAHLRVCCEEHGRIVRLPRRRALTCNLKVA